MRRASVKELAQRLMRDALREHIAAMRWRSQNRRRLELIAGKQKAPLPAEEVAAFQQLQALAHERCLENDTNQMICLLSWICVDLAADTSYDLFGRDRFPLRRAFRQVIVELASPVRRSPS